jgi:hypothetical protein
VLIAPVLMVLVFSLMAWQRPGGSDVVFLRSGVGLGVFGVFIAMMSMSPILMNLFAIDRAGLTLTFLAPIPDRELLKGKIAAVAMLLALPLSICLIVTRDRRTRCGSRRRWAPWRST